LIFSLYSNPETSGSLVRKDVLDLTDKWSGDKITVIASNVDAQDLGPLVEESFSSATLAPSSLPTTSPASVYHGGNESRIISAGESYYAVAFSSVPRVNVSQHAAALVLRSLLNGTSRIPFGSGAGLTPVSTAAFYNGYSDAGLVGFVVSGGVGEIKAAVQQGFDVLKSLASGKEDVMSASMIDRAKASAIVGVDGGAYVDAAFGASVDLSVKGGVSSARDLVDAIAKVGKSDVVKV
jgi:hypothetical protein